MALPTLTTATLSIHRAAVVLERFLIEWSSADAAADFNACVRDRFGSSTERRKRRARLLDWQGGVCPKCGNDIVMDSEDTGQWAHLIPATFHGAANAVHAGFMWGNLQVWHTSCNATWGERLTVASDLARPDLWFTGTTRDLPAYQG